MPEEELQAPCSFSTKHQIPVDALPSGKSCVLTTSVRMTRLAKSSMLLCDISAVCCSAWWNDVKPRVPVSMLSCQHITFLGV